MHDINTNYYKVVHEERRRMATQFFYKQRIARLQRREKMSDGQGIHTQFRGGINWNVVQRLIRLILGITRRRVRSHEVE